MQTVPAFFPGSERAEGREWGRLTSKCRIDSKVFRELARISHFAVGCHGGKPNYSRVQTVRLRTVQFWKQLAHPRPLVTN